jgi:hypothetical protein
MHRTRHRVAASLAAGLAALAFASPALAGSDGCDDDGCRAENSPATVVPVPPQPQTIAPVPSAPEATATTRVERGTHATAGAPRGAVFAGAGGTAPQSPETLPAVLAGAGVALLVAGGSAAAATRRSAS